MSVLGDLSNIPKWLSADWLPTVLTFYRSFKQLLEHESHEGLYEILEYDSTLELVDSKGASAILKKRQRVKFLQDNIIAFEDFAWGDGEVLAGYKVSPGIEADRYQVGGRWNILISLRDIKSSGDVEDFYIERHIKRGFTGHEEWWQAEMQHRTRSLKASIIFPARRHCQQAMLIERNRKRTTPLDASHFSILPDGRQVVHWEIVNPKHFETYTIQWNW